MDDEPQRPRPNQIYSAAATSEFFFTTKPLDFTLVDYPFFSKIDVVE